MSTMSPWHVTTDKLQLRRSGKLIEELGELVAVAGRWIIQGIDEVDPSSGDSNRQRLQDEIADVIAQCRCTILAMGLNHEAVDERIARKVGQMGEWECALIVDAAGQIEQPSAGRGTGTHCSECGSPQVHCPSGITCANGHGGAPAREEVGA